MKTLNQYINESRDDEYGLGSVDDVLLFWENDEELYRTVEATIKSMLKKEKREQKKDPDFKLSKETLMKSSVMGKMVRDAINKYSKQIERISPVTTQFRNALRKEFTDSIFISLDDWRDYDKDED